MPGLTKVQKALEEVKADAIAVQTRRIEDWRRDNPEAAAELDSRLAEGLEITKAKQDDGSVTEKPLAKQNKTELTEVATNEGVEVPQGATNAQIVEAIEAKRNENA